MNSLELASASGLYRVMKHAQTTAQAEAPNTGWIADIASWLFLLFLVFGFHSLIAKPFYIPSESMMPTLLTGDRLVVSKYPYGWSWVSPPFRILPPMKGRLFGQLPKRGDIVIVVPPGQGPDFIKRVIGLPGDELEMVEGQLFINEKPVPRRKMPDAVIPLDPNLPCSPDGYGDRRVTGADGKAYCRLPVFRETLPDGRSYDTIDMGFSEADSFARLKVSPGHVFLMGDHRDRSADSRVPTENLGLGGPVPFENIGGRAEFISFSVDGSSRYLNPLSWFTALRGGRAGASLRPAGQEPAGG